jgi:hypothetical protein
MENGFVGKQIKGAGTSTSDPPRGWATIQMLAATEEAVLLAAWIVNWRRDPATTDKSRAVSTITAASDTGSHASPAKSRSASAWPGF